MQKLEYIIRNLAPVNFAEKSGDSVLYVTKKYIPGNALRGACASLYLKNHAIQGDAHLDQGFAKLFLSGKVRFLPAYPCHSPELLQSGYEPVVLPASLMKSKMQRETDNYIDLAGGSTAKAGYKKFSGFAMVKTTADGTEIIKVDTKTKIEMHMKRQDANERIGGRSINRDIFNYEYIIPYQYFAGSVLFDDDIAEAEIRALLQNTLYLGRSKTAQYGKCECTVLKANNDTPDNGSVGTYLFFKTPYIPEAEWQNMDQPIEEIIASLQADGVAISSASGKAYAGSEEINGYVGVWNLKRSCINAVSAGSLIAIEVEPDKENLAKLQEALQQGLGFRTEEGFGQLELWSPMQNIVMAAAPEETVSCVLDEVVKVKAREILEARLFVELHKQSEADAKAIFGISGKHILKRIESLMGTDLTKLAIQNHIESMENTAQTNLKNMALKGSYIYDLLVGHSQAPYDFNLLLKKMSIEDGPALFKEIGFELKPELEERIYKEYWLWTMRFAAKKGGNSNGK